MNKTYRILCTIDVGYEDTPEDAIDTLIQSLPYDGNEWEPHNLQVLNVEEVLEKEI
jgi:hypothetical protein